MNAVTEMYSLEKTGPDWFRRQLPADAKFGESHYASVCDCLAFDQADSSQLRQRRELLYTRIRQSMAAGQVNIPDPITHFDQMDHSRVRDLGAMAQMDVMQVLPQSGDGIHRSVCNILAFCEDEVAQSWRCFNDLLYRVVVHLVARSQI